ncbi:SGNH/GDSL hydrolase family protein, partial [Elusimicrobiota bacterium]
ISWNSDEISTGRWAIKNITTLLKKNKIAVNAVIVPYLKKKYTYDEQLSYLSMKKLLNEFSIKHLDLHGKFKDIEDARWRREKSDSVHPSEAGHRLMSEHIHSFLINNFEHKH